MAFVEFNARRQPEAGLSELKSVARSYFPAVEIEVVVRELDLATSDIGATCIHMILLSTLSTPGVRFVRATKSLSQNPKRGGTANVKQMPIAYLFVNNKLTRGTSDGTSRL